MTAITKSGSEEQALDYGSLTLEELGERAASNAWARGAAEGWAEASEWMMGRATTLFEHGDDRKAQEYREVARQLMGMRDKRRAELAVSYGPYEMAARNELERRDELLRMAEENYDLKAEGPDWPTEDKTLWQVLTAEFEEEVEPLS
jgi:hypothetical protein